MMGIALKKYVEDPLIWPRTVEARQYQKTISEKTIQKNTERALHCMHASIPHSTKICRKKI